MMASLRFGSVVLPHGLMLAPMAGVTDASFRMLCRRAGAEYTVSEMVSAKALCFEQKSKRAQAVRTAPLAAVSKEEAPMAVQLFGSEPDYMREAALLLESGNYLGATGDLPPAAIDINMGCPVPKVVTNGEGSALMKDPKRAAAIVTAIKRAISLPVTVKIRAGWDENSKNAPEFAQRIEAAGADLIVVHGRTRQQFYAPSSDNRVIAAVKQAVKIPVVGNGDLFSAADVKKMYDETGCDGVMIARGAMGNPFLFTEIIAAEENRAYQRPTDEERLALALSHAADMVAKKGTRVGLAEARKHMLWYCKGLRGAAPAREALTHAESLEEIRTVFDQLLEKRK
ncbi:MAG: tRNA dihydrouridine synthase DusB [Ruminococcaceae bacterium]|nr:tRNA dihydrouridine synthase DusB [Oscillospiraceae bacterium]